MSIWAAILTLVVAALALLVADPPTLLAGLGEIAAVVTLFALVCAAEAWN
jgi:hypothetical protein